MKRPALEVDRFDRASVTSMDKRTKSDKAVMTVRQCIIGQKGSKGDVHSFTPEDSEERVCLPAGPVGGTRWGNECSGGRIERDTVTCPGNMFSFQSEVLNVYYKNTVSHRKYHSILCNEKLNPSNS